MLLQCVHVLGYRNPFIHVHVHVHVQCTCIYLYIRTCTAKHLRTYYVPSVWSGGGRVGSELLAVSTDLCWPAIKVFSMNEK